MLGLNTPPKRSGVTTLCVNTMSSNTTAPHVVKFGENERSMT